MSKFYNVLFVGVFLFLGVIGVNSVLMGFVDQSRAGECSAPQTRLAKVLLIETPYNFGCWLGESE
jgi:hypothetical protein